MHGDATVGKCRIMYINAGHPRGGTALTLRTKAGTGNLTRTAPSKPGLFVDRDLRQSEKNILVFQPSRKVKHLCYAKFSLRLLLFKFNFTL